MEKKNKRFKIILNAISIVGTILMCIFLIYAFKAQIFTSEEKMQLFIEATGGFAPLIFVIIQIIQVVIPIIPGGVSIGVGVLLFGPLLGFILNYVGIVIGSIIVFFISRKYGMPLIEKLFSQKIIDKYKGWLDKGKKFDIFFAIAIFLPVAPDDFLCYLAGLTSISTLKYIAIIVFLKPFTISLYSGILAVISKLIFKV